MLIIHIWPGTYSLIAQLARYKPGWKFSVRAIQGDANYELFIDSLSQNSDDPTEMWRASHSFILPDDVHLWDNEQCMRHLMQSIMLVEAHEAGEFFHVNGKRIFPPGHGPNVELYATPWIN